MTLTKKLFRHSRKLRLSIVSLLFLALTLSHAGCFLDENLDRYYGRIVVPRSQEFQWSDGGLPQTFDPAFAAAPPDTDLVRAIFEGLTDYDPRSLTPVPAVATRWEASNGGRVWTFYLREDARWSNGEPVTAADFVRSWRRTMRIGDLAPHTELLANIQGARLENAAAAGATKSPGAQSQKQTTAADSVANTRGSTNAVATNDSAAFGVEAVSDQVLRVRLRRPDLNFPALVAHPVFRPVKLNDESTTSKLGAEELVSNGAFSLAKNESTRVLLERADTYWNKDQVALEHVSFVGQKDAESALAAYRTGEVDAVTNASFGPLVIKLLKPYEDFRRTTYGALTYYSFNSSHAPFDDVRVREALAIAIDRDRISADDMGGATEPAKRFLPETASNTAPVVNKADVLEKEYERAKQLLAEAGFPGGSGFPKVKLLINRNEPQRVVAQSVATMWRTVLNIETEIVIKNWDEYEAAIRAGEYDVVRRGLVMQTTDELTNIRMLFPEGAEPGQAANVGKDSDTAVGASPDSRALKQKKPPPPQSIETEAQALRDLSAMPIYFSSSYSLVKPYVSGFDANVLDAPSLKTVRINTSWKKPETAGANTTR